MYAPSIGFMQTDPIGYAGGANLYEPMGSNPVNFVDPLGLDDAPILIIKQRDDSATGAGIFIIGSRIGPSAGDTPITPMPAPVIGGSQGNSGGGGGAIVVTAQKQQKPQKHQSKPNPYKPNIDYCGGQGSASLPNNIGGASINDICYAHDICYGGSGTPKAVCDNNFFEGIIKRVGINTNFIDINTRLFVTFLTGLIGYELIHLGGGRFYVQK